MKDNSSKFLKTAFPGLHEEGSVLARAGRVSDEKVGSLAPEQRIGRYLTELEKHDDPEVWKRYLGKFALSSISEQYVHNERRRLIELGYGGDIGFDEGEISAEQRQKILESVREDQQGRLSEWVDYFAENDADYPAWFKYYVTRNVLTLTEYDLASKKFPKRSEDTVANFPEIDYEALATVYEKLSAIIDGDSTDKDIKQLASSGFAKLYGDAVRELSEVSRNHELGTEGEWRRFDQGSKGSELAETLKGRRTGWCTTSPSTAAGQLKRGDFYVYYTYGPTRVADTPRVAIRLEKTAGAMQVVEVRGVEAKQALEPDFLDIASDKLHELPGGEQYDKKVRDMRALTAIQRKTTNAEDLDEGDLMFLYEIGEDIQGFGQRRDPRIAQCMQGRDAHADFGRISGLLESTPITPEKLKSISMHGRMPKIVTVDGSFDTHALHASARLPLSIMASDSVRIRSGTYRGKAEFIRAEKNITLEHVNWTELPNIELSGNLVINNVPICDLPENLHLAGDLKLHRTNVIRLPSGLMVDGMLKWKVSHPTVFDLGDAVVGGSIDLSGSQFTSLARPIHVKGNLILSKTKISELPDGLVVEGNLDLRGSAVREISKGVTVNGDILMDPTGLLDDADVGGVRIKSGSSIYHKKTKEDGTAVHVFSQSQEIDLSKTRFASGDSIVVGSKMDIRNGVLSNNRLKASRLDMEDIRFDVGTRIATKSISVKTGIRRYNDFPVFKGQDQQLPEGYEVTANDITIDKKTAKELFARVAELYVDGDADLSVPGSLQIRLPELMRVAGSLSLYGLDLSRLSDGSIVIVGGNLDIRYTNLTRLPSGWTVGGDVRTNVALDSQSYDQVVGDIMRN